MSFPDEIYELMKATQPQERGFFSQFMEEETNPSDPETKVKEPEPE